MKIIKASRSMAFLIIAMGTQLCAAQVTCTLEKNGAEVTMAVKPEPHSLGGQWQEMEPFRIRALLAMPLGKNPWLLIEIYVKSEGGDYRILSSHKVFKPFSTGRMEVIEPSIGRSLFYQCNILQ
jgi:hypothetical protein